MNLETSQEQNLLKDAFARFFAAPEPCHRDSINLLDLTAPESIVRQPEGLGYLERDHRRSTATTIYGGAGEVLRSMVAERALGPPRNR